MGSVNSSPPAIPLAILVVVTILFAVPRLHQSVDRGLELPGEGIPLRWLGADEEEVHALLRLRERAEHTHGDVVAVFAFLGATDATVTGFGVQDQECLFHCLNSLLTTIWLSKHCSGRLSSRIRCIEISMMCKFFVPLLYLTSTTSPRRG